MADLLDTEALICEVKKYPQLWDVNCDDFRFKRKKLQAWYDIARIIVEDFDVIPERKKLEIYRKLHDRWRNVRDSYVRTSRRQPPGKKPYIHAPLLTFLNDPCKSDISENHEHENWNSNKPTIKLKKNKDHVIIEDIHWNESDNDSNTDLKRNKHDAVMVDYADIYPQALCNTNAEDEDRSFFDSLLPAVRELNIDQKLEFRTEILCLLKQIRANGFLK